MDIHKRIEQARELAGLTRHDLAKACSVSYQAVQQWETGNTKPAAKTLLKIATATNSDPYWLINGGNRHNSDAVRDTRSNYSIDTEPTAHKPHLVPLISWVQAGAWCDASDPYPVGEAESFEPCPFDHSECAYYLRVVGDSMFPEYLEGALILVDPAIEPQHGDDVIARTPEGQVTFKRLQITPDGTYLLALNPDWQPRRINIPADTQICGVITGTWTNKRRRNK